MGLDSTDWTETS